MKYWEIMVNNMTKAGFSLGWISALDNNGRMIWIIDAHRDGKRFVARTDEKLIAFFWNLKRRFEARPSELTSWRRSEEA
jgi:hypothetical protein